MKKIGSRFTKSHLSVTKQCSHPRKPFIIYLALLSVLNLIASEEILAQNGKTVKLRVEKHFPNADDKIILAGPTDLDIDERNNIYVCDYILSSILKFSLQGEFLASIGKAGKGPGEFKQQSRFCYDNGKIYIVDQAQRRIQIMTSDGRYVDQFMVVDIPDALTAHQGKIYRLNRNNHLHWSFEKQKPNDLIWTLDEGGRRMFAFGDHLDFDDVLSPPTNITPSVSTALIKVFNDRVYLLFIYYPILRVYDLEGVLQKTIRFKEMQYEKRVPGNYKWENFQRKKVKLPFKFLFRAFDVNATGIFIALYNPEGLMIDQFDHNGNFKKRYTKDKTGEEYDLRDFVVIPTANSKARFAILHEEDGVPRVAICEE